MTNSETKLINVIAKCKTKEEMNTSLADYVLKNKELLVETEGENETFVARFKIGDGITPYKQLPYVSNLYKLYPNFILYSNDYSYGINIVLKDEVGE